MSSTTLIIPGLGGSGPEHWQSIWLNQRESCVLVDGIDYNLPDRNDWLDALDAAITRCEQPPMLVAHSLGCILVAHWARRHDRAPVAGALLVAPADVDSAAHTPAEAHVFAPVPLRMLPFPAIVAASSNDPYIDIERAKTFATAWSASFINLGPMGHLNGDSHLGAWDDGWHLLQTLNATAQAQIIA